MEGEPTRLGGGPGGGGGWCFIPSPSDRGHADVGGGPGGGGGCFGSEPPVTEDEDEGGRPGGGGGGDLGAISSGNASMRRNPS